MTNPYWQVFCEAKYQSRISNAFILTGNIGDYAKDDSLLINYMYGWLSRTLKMDEIYLYNINAEGRSLCNRRNHIPFDEIIDLMISGERNDAFIFTYPEYTIPSGDNIQESEKKRIIALHTAMNSAGFLRSKKIVFFITESTTGIHPMFTGGNSKMTVYNIPLPFLKRRYDFITEWWEKHQSEKYGITMTGINDTILANLTAGLQLITIEKILLTACAKRYIDSTMVMETKKEIIQKEYGEVIEVYETFGYTLKQFAGKEEIKTYFRQVIINALKENDRSIIPKGVLFMGPPGTGKTYFAKCLAGESGINFIEFKMSKILGKYVGESEKAMEKALSVMRALAPVGIFIDEIDQIMARSQGMNDGGSRVNANLFSMLLAEMSKNENRGRIIWIAATNYPNNVDEALKRSGRFDKKIPFFAPTEKERELVFKFHIEETGLKATSDVDLKKLAQRTEGYTQAEIEGIVVKALEFAKRNKCNVISQEDLVKACIAMLSNQNIKIKEMEDLALIECNDLEFIPYIYI